jgi:hypothetical protein
MMGEVVPIKDGDEEGVRMMMKKTFRGGKGCLR